MDLNDFKWLNKSEMTADEDRITVCAPGMTDYFNSPVPENGRLQKPQGDAPFFYTEITGDFVARVKAKPNFLTTYDAASLMMIHDENLWIKAAFEKSDFGTTAVVSVVTNTVSDDANGCNVDADAVWLQLARAGNNFIIHYSLDGERFDMVRLCSLPVPETVKVGIEAQCPAGEGGTREFSGFTIEKRRLSDLRAGI